MKNFADKLLEAIDEKKNLGIVGLDPRIEQIPEHIKEEAKEKYGNNFKSVASAFMRFNEEIIKNVKDIVPAVKPQSAFYEPYGSEGIKALEYTIDFARKNGLIVILDAKRNDIGSTSKAYADSYLGEVKKFNGETETSFSVDAITVNPYLGSDGIIPFLEVCKEFGKGIFILDKTSNPSSGEFQDKRFENGNKLSEEVAIKINEWGKELIGERGYSSIGAVVGVTYPEDAQKLRELMPVAIFLAPGYGTQGGKGEDIPNFLNKDCYGVVVSSSRGIIFAYLKDPYKNEFTPEEFGKAARQAAINMREDILNALEKYNKLPDNW